MLGNLAVTVRTHIEPYVSKILQCIEICVKKIRSDGFHQRKTKKSVLHLGGRKIGWRVTAGFVSLK